MEYLVNEKNAGIILEISDNIHQNEKYLSELDGAAGDGDHGVNMNKGFSLAKERIQTNMSFSEGLNILRKVLMEEIGGSMGPIYGTLFTKIYRTIKRENIITAELFLSALHNAVTGLMDLGGAKVGRASRLGERSRGHIDAGAASCCVILTSMADAIQEVMVLD